MNVSSSLKTLENPTKHSQKAVLKVTKTKNIAKRKSASEDTSKLSAANLKCNGCGAHVRAKCIFRDAICHKCSIKGHIAKVCHSTSEQPKDPKYVTVSLLGKLIALQYDTGSDITVISKKEWIRIGKLKLTASDPVTPAGGSELDIIGRFYCPIRTLDHTGEIYI